MTALLSLLSLSTTGWAGPPPDLPVRTLLEEATCDATIDLVFVGEGPDEAIGDIDGEGGVHLDGTVGAGSAQITVQCSETATTCVGVAVISNSRGSRTVSAELASVGDEVTLTVYDVSDHVLSFSHEVDCPRDAAS